MPITIALREHGRPVKYEPVTLMFNGSVRRDGVTDMNGDFVVEGPCPGTDVTVMIRQSTVAVGHPCHDGAVVEVEITT
jgi:hypothetical protein